MVDRETKRSEGRQLALRLALAVLLANAGIAFEAIPADIDEQSQELSPEPLTLAAVTDDDGELYLVYAVRLY